MNQRRRRRRFTRWEKVNLALILLGFSLAGFGWLISVEILQYVGMGTAVLMVIVSPFEGSGG